MKTFLFFVLGFLLGALGMYMYVMQSLEGNFNVLIDQAVSSVQNSLPADLVNAPTNASWWLSQEFAQKRYDDQKLKIEQELQEKKEEMKQSLTDSLKTFLTSKVDSILGNK